MPWDVGVEVRARVASILGGLSLALLMVAPCTCGGTVPFAGLLGAVALILGLRSRREEPLSPAGDVFALVAILTGAFSGLSAGAVVLFGMFTLVGSAMDLFDAVF